MPLTKLSAIKNLLTPFTFVIISWPFSIYYTCSSLITSVYPCDVRWWPFPIVYLMMDFSICLLTLKLLFWNFLFHREAFKIAFKQQVFDKLHPKKLTFVFYEFLQPYFDELIISLWFQAVLEIWQNFEKIFKWIFSGIDQNRFRTRHLIHFNWRLNTWMIVLTILLAKIHFEQLCIFRMNSRWVTHLDENHSFR